MVQLRLTLPTILFKYNVSTEFKVNAQILLPSLSPEQRRVSAMTTSVISFYLLLQFTEQPLFTLFSQTIIQVSTEITKIIHHMNRTKHAHCSTRVLCTWQLTRAFTHFMQNYLHVLQNRLLKFKKCLYLFVFLHFTNSSSEINTSFCLYFESVVHFIIRNYQC